MNHPVLPISDPAKHDVNLRTLAKEIHESLKQERGCPSFPGIQKVIKALGKRWRCRARCAHEIAAIYRKAGR